MITLVTGGSKCGKSHFAEKMLDDFCGRKFYIATMQPYGEEAHAAIARHREMRKNKGFETIDKYTDIGELILPAGSSVLLECIGNLCANEMFREGKMLYPTEKIVNEVRRLGKSVSELVIVTNQVGGDGVSYAKGTSEYISAMGEINRKIAELADNVIECVYGIPIVLKGIISC